MNVTFIRHGHGEHLLDYPNQLNCLHPGLTELGKSQVIALRKQVNFSPEDTILVSPTKRTIETACLLAPTSNLMFSPLVGPRMFPQNPEFVPFVCDQIYSKEELSHQYTDIKMIELGLDCWEESINQMDACRFKILAEQLLEWCRQQSGNTFVISHDGTITNYRMLLGEQGLSKSDFLGEAGQYTMRNV
ncbi:phosphoglycerate mutase family protein [Paenibacillus sp. 1781tsa1]|uniref:phosphoglycerate mutase family protein n=1 Tax=Paenibacillus sp. 1781tsa1 TaxID=2953810 RepID=UPI00209D9B78|nr:phosphoglycerate mutase family protein [Paenibacillus sp. 1781tsa1]MCP1182997.1 histidine phosphatase family protein [Paenibacillus sp. 1781tsa1]